jgi:microcystin-dependent protein
MSEVLYERLVQGVIGLVHPAGTIYLDAANNRAGAVLCDGSELSRTEYFELFQAIGTKFGAGDGKTTFNLPDIRSPGQGICYYIYTGLTEDELEAVSQENNAEVIAS